MDDRVLETNDDLSIDLQRFFSALIKKIWLIALVAVLCAALALAVTVFFIAPKYQSSVMFYVNNSSLSLGDVSMNITSSDISASRGLVKSYIVILNTRETLNDVIDYAGVDCSYGALKGMISAAAVDSTEVFKVTVTSEDPEEAEALANAIAYILPKRIDSIIDGTSAKIVDSAVLPSGPSSPSYTTNTALGFIVGVVAVCALTVLQVIFDIMIRTEEDIIQVAGEHPLLAAIPDMVAPTKGGYYKRRRKYYTYKQQETGRHTAVVGSGISFIASEAYKLLRTKLQFSFADDKKCHVVGVSSALAGEGKSLTSVNLAYSLSQLGKRVLLIECDMRCPSISEKLKIQNTTGLSEFLSGQTKEENLIQYCGIKDDERAFHVITSGPIPPNPMELLSSKRMEMAVNKLRQNYDYIILDLPPVNEVSDALTTTNVADGMLVVVRQNYCNRNALAEALRQFQFVGTKILGLVFNYTTDESASYGNRYMHRYYKRYGYYWHYRHYNSRYSYHAHHAKEQE